MPIGGCRARRGQRTGFLVDIVHSRSQPCSPSTCARIAQDTNPQDGLEASCARRPSPNVRFDCFPFRSDQRSDPSLGQIRFPSECDPGPRAVSHTPWSLYRCRTSQRRSSKTSIPSPSSSTLRASLSCLATTLPSRVSRSFCARGTYGDTRSPDPIKAWLRPSLFSSAISCF